MRPYLNLKEGPAPFAIHRILCEPPQEEPSLHSLCRSCYIARKRKVQGTNEQIRKHLAAERIRARIAPPRAQCACSRRGNCLGLEGNSGHLGGGDALRPAAMFRFPLSGLIDTEEVFVTATSIKPVFDARDRGILGDELGRDGLGEKDLGAQIWSCFKYSRFDCVSNSRHIKVRHRSEVANRGGSTKRYSKSGGARHGEQCPRPTKTQSQSV